MGGFAISLRHRHDIRVGIASGMLLRSVVLDGATRVALLAALYPAYWRWSTSMLLNSICARMHELLRAQPLARAEILREAWAAMSNEMAKCQVVGVRDKCKVSLLPRTEANRPRSKNNGSVDGLFRYHPFSNPSSRRTGLAEFHVLLHDLCSGSLWRACAELASLLTSSPTYAKAVEVVKKHGIKLWSDRGRYNRVRSMTLE